MKRRWICFIPRLSHAFHSYVIYLNETCVLISEYNNMRPISTYLTIMRHVSINVVWKHFLYYYSNNIIDYWNWQLIISIVYKIICIYLNNFSINLQNVAVVAYYDNITGHVSSIQHLHYTIEFKDFYYFVLNIQDNSVYCEHNTCFVIYRLK